MFVLKEVEEFEWPVKVTVPKNGGKRESVKFMARFALQDSETTQRLVQDPETRDYGELLRLAVIKTWDLEIQDEAGDTVEDDDERNRILLGNVLFRNATFDAYSKGCAGKGGKN